jgi:phage terminase large subunit-like protein
MTTTTLPSPDSGDRLSCPPRWGTARNPDRPTLGPRVAEVAKRVGTPLMPWQQHVVDVALEVDPETGELAYSELGLTVPRQSGKTTLWLALMVHRALGFGPPHGQRQNILYTAQTRNDARKKFEDEHVKVLEGSSLRRHFRTRMTNGSEAILWRNGSKHGITSTTEKAGHGETIDLAVTDEVFALVDDRLEQALKPAMVTRRNALFGWTSTAGTAQSLYLLSKVELGRAVVQQGGTKGVAFFEWSADPSQDPADPVTWRGCMPALGITVRESSVAMFQQTMSPKEFRRAFLNIADTESAVDAAIDPTVWRRCADAASKIGGPLAFAIDVNPERTWAAIAVAGERTDGRMHLEVVEHRQGTDWVVERMVELRNQWSPAAIVVDGASPAGALIADLGSAGLDVTTATARDIAQACGML